MIELMNFHQTVVSLLVSGIFALAITQPEGEPVPRFGNASLEVVLAGLPNVDEEYWRDEETGSYVTHPAVAELEERLNVGLKMTDKQWRRALLDTGALRVQRTWPAGQPYSIARDKPGWLGMSTIRLVPRREGLEPIAIGIPYPVSCGNYGDHLYSLQRDQSFGLLPVGEHKLVFDVVVTRGQTCLMQGCSHPKPGRIWRGPLRVKVRVVEDSDYRGLPGGQSALDPPLATGGV